MMFQGPENTEIIQLANGIKKVIILNIRHLYENINSLNKYFFKFYLRKYF